MHSHGHSSFLHLRYRPSAVHGCSGVVVNCAVLCRQPSLRWLDIRQCVTDGQTAPDRQGQMDAHGRNGYRRCPSMTGPSAVPSDGAARLTVSPARAASEAVSHDLQGPLPVPTADVTWSGSVKASCWALHRQRIRPAHRDADWRVICIQTPPGSHDWDHFQQAPWSD